MAAVSYGGQAVLEGVMMRSPSSWAVAIRTPEGEITEVVQDVTSPMQRRKLWRLPVVRGVVALGESLAIGFRALAISANVASQERDENGEIQTQIGRGQIIFSFAIAIGFARLQTLRMPSSSVGHVLASTRPPCVLGLLGFRRRIWRLLPGETTDPL